ncbi:MAG: ATP-binding protein [Desulfobacteraceae bacterium]|nr:ATP-binding protein [Desulfobacteraceae bacterium]
MRTDFVPSPIAHNFMQLYSAASGPAGRQNGPSAEEAFWMSQFIMDNCSDAAYWLTPEGKILYVNEQACRVLEYSRDELAQLTIYDVDPNFREDTWADHWQVIKNNHCLRLASVHRTKSGRIIPVDISSHHVEIGGRQYNCAFARDLTEQRQIERQNRDYESRLNAAQRMEALGILAGGIAHDFNNILSSILGFSELAIEGLAQENPQYDHIREIYTAGLRAKELVNQILTFSRQAEHEKQPIQLKLIVKEVLKLLRASMPATIAIRTNIQSNGLVMADPSQLHQILMNLATNARHAMQTDGGTLNVELKELELDPAFCAAHPEIDPGRYVQLSVADSGHGIAPEIIERIFEPFFTTKKKGEGTGLGLSMVHGIVRDHGGTITVQSVLGQGTTFHVFLPLMQLSRTRTISEKEILPTGSEHILLVDDEPALVTMASQMLERLGYRVTSRANPSEALALFQENASQFDLVLTDLTMPHLPGNKLATELLKIRPEIPIILCTGYSGELSDLTMEEIGVKALITKPILKKDLSLLVRKVLDEGKLDSPP